MTFKEFLLRDGYLANPQLRAKFDTLVNEGADIEAALNGVGIDNDKILMAKSAFYHVPGKSLVQGQIPERVLKLVPERSIEQYGIIPFELTDKELHIGFLDPGDAKAREAADFIATANQLNFRPYVITRFDFDRIHNNINVLSTEVSSALNDLEAELVAESFSSAQPETTTEEAVSEEDAPITKIVATIVKFATEGSASDIHIEPYENETRVRFRVDGALKQSLTLPKATHSALVARIKILANMKLDERRKPQDGRFSAHVEGRKIDFRASTFPTSYGEKVVMRILDSERGVAEVEDLGLSERNYSLIEAALKEPYGLILISGPTGSGKSTTLYSMLKKLDRLTRNVISLEDPVEYQIDNVTQSSVNPDIGYTFASGLRSTLRQDPDVIMVGEIRDKETAKLAIQAALTGHLVLSTIHTNSAAGVIPRLIDMEVDPYLIAPTLKLAIAQRLVKRICPAGGKEIPVEGSIRRMIDEEFKDLSPEFRKDIHYPRYVLGAQPSPGCPRGTQGRVAVFEVIKQTKLIEEVLLKDPNEAAVYQAARRDGMLTMREDAILKAFAHEIPFEEVNKLGTNLFID